MGVKDYLRCVAGGHRGLGIFCGSFVHCGHMRSAAVPKKCAYVMVEAIMQSAFQNFVYHGLLEPAGRRISDGASDKGFAVQA